MYMISRESGVVLLCNFPSKRYLNVWPFLLLGSNKKLKKKIPKPRSLVCQLDTITTPLIVKAKLFQN